jgi:glutathione S-transferase
MKLYGNFFSTCTRKVLITLAEKGLEADFVSIDLGKGEQKAPAYLTKHPFGVVPLFEEDSIRMMESRAICRYLDFKYDHSSLTPQDHKSRAKMEQWTSLEQSYLEPAAGKIFQQRVMAPIRKQTPDQSAIQAGLQGVRQFLGLLDQQLRTDAYVAGEQFSLADIFLMPYHDFLSFSQEATIFYEFPHVTRWWERVQNRSSWQQFEK